jgi:hypothetical protein
MYADTLSSRLLTSVLGKRAFLALLLIYGQTSFHSSNVWVWCASPRRGTKPLLQERLSLFPHLKYNIPGRNGFGHRS